MSDDTVSSSGKQEDAYRNTVFLPHTSFPMRGNLPVREPEIIKKWQDMAVDEQIRQQCKTCPPFVLHDGPPYANGHIHIGHALNKIIKDVINRARRMSGWGVGYVPGWDCHGLPIEWRVEEEYRKSGRDKEAVPLLEFRSECREYARKWMDIQSAEFQRLGVQGEWNGRYSTMDYSSEAAIVEELGKFLLNGMLYRGLRPVMWSTVEKTALAEAEIEYHDHTSNTMYIAFPVVYDPTPGRALDGVSAVIWTTTPWTIPANRAIAFGPDITYVVMRVDGVDKDALTAQGSRYLVAEDLLPAFCKAVGIIAHHVVYTLSGHLLMGTLSSHPLRGRGYDFDVPFLPGDFVTTDAGTGLVHMAPAHGEDDFFLCKSHGVDVAEIVQDDGLYVPWLSEFGGIHVFKATAPVQKALTEVMEHSKRKGLSAAGLLAQASLVHSYPHSWRSHAPLIYRATPQWFIRMDGDVNIRDLAIAALEKIIFVPLQSRNRLTSMVANRPDWCISRQRAWGVPIAVFVNRQTNEVLRDPQVMECIVEAFRNEGADCWYNSPASRFLGQRYNPDDYEQIFDIVDVWFESGSTHAFVLNRPDLPWPADLCVEGSDQHRGWFQSSLLESIGTRGKAPFKALLTCGFVVDDQGRKMSKSVGNVIAPRDIIDAMGADILRLWVMNADTSDDLRISKNILRQQSELYRRLRNTLRWLLGSLADFRAEEALPYKEFPELEKWILHRLTELRPLLGEAVDTHDWTGVYPALHNFCTIDLSAFYFDIRKDSLYCDAVDNLRRRAARTVLNHLHRHLCCWLAPVLVFTAEEAWLARSDCESSIHLEQFPHVEPEWSNHELAERWQRIRGVRRAITTEIEAARRGERIGSSLQARVVLPLSKREAEYFRDCDWAEIAIVSQVEVDIRPESVSVYLPIDKESGEPHGLPIVHVAEGRKCLRCWKVLEEVGRKHDYPDLCLRCYTIVAQKNK